MQEEAGKVVGATAGIVVTSLVFPFGETVGMADVMLLIASSATLGGILGKSVVIIVSLIFLHQKSRSGRKRVQRNAASHAHIKRFLGTLHRNLENLIAFIKKVLGQALNLVTKN